MRFRVVSLSCSANKVDELFAFTMKVYPFFSPAAMGWAESRNVGKSGMLVDGCSDVPGKTKSLERMGAREC